ncbi:MAG: exosortase/archaeosortase family protein [Lacunisphaera sp.]
MNQPIEAPSPVAQKSSKEISSQDGLRRLWPAVLGLAVCFIQPLYQLVKLAFSDDLYSHIPLIPLVSLYLIWTQRSELPRASAPYRPLAPLLALAGVIALGISLAGVHGGFDLTAEDVLALRIGSLLFFIGGATTWLLGRKTLSALAFPLLFLIFMLPFPTAVRAGLESFLQYGSAAVAHVLFTLAGTSVFYHDLTFRLSDISLHVAPECSGIRSSLALFITSVVAGHFFLRSRWKCAVLSLAVIPLALLRNGFRIFTIGELCVHINPDMINSYIHRKGGPIFFALSLIPFFLLLWLLLRSEPRVRSPHPTALPK